MLYNGDRAKMQERYDTLQTEMRQAELNDPECERFNSDAAYRCEQRKKKAEKTILFYQLKEDTDWQDMTPEKVFKINKWEWM